MIALEIRDLMVRLPGQDAPVLEGVSLSVAAGEIVALLGESGAGKTTLAQAICALLPEGSEHRGEVLLAGLPAGPARRGLAVAPVFQVPRAGLSPVRRVGGQIADALRMAGRAAGDVSGLLAGLGLDPGVARCYPHQLSGGMAQRVAIVRAMATGAALIVADEPTSALDLPNARAVAATLAQARDAGRAVLLITHDRAMAAHLADRMLELRGGRIVAAQADFRPAIPEALPPAGPPLLELVGIGCRDRRLEDVSLAIRRGEVLALTGASGAGKSTLARLVARLDSLQAGDIRLDGAGIGDLSPAGFARDARRSRIQMVFQEAGASFAPRQTLRQSILAAQQRLGRPMGAIDPAARQAGLAPELLDRRPGALSQGQLARAALARALAAGPDLLVLDEPTAALDHATRAGVLRLLAGLRGQGMAILLVTHDLAAAAQLADRLAVLQAGRLVEIGATARLFAAPAHPATQALVAAMW